MEILRGRWGRISQKKEDNGVGEWKRQETAPLVNSWKRGEWFFTAIPVVQSSKHQPLCSHKNSTKICEHRKSSSAREKVQDRHKVHQISTGHTKSHGKEDTERLYQLEIAERSSRMGQMDQTEMQLNHNTQIFGNGCTLKDTPWKLEVPRTGQTWSRISEVWWADVAQARKCWPSNKQRQGKYTASPVDFGTN